MEKQRRILSGFSTTLRPPIEGFYTALRDGDLSYFLPIFHIRGGTAPDDTVPTAQRILRGILQRYNETRGVAVFSNQLHTLYCALTGLRGSYVVPFAKALVKHGFSMGTHGIYGVRNRGIRINFRHSDIAYLRATYLQDERLEETKRG